MIPLLLYGMGGQEWIWIFLVILVATLIVRNIKRNAAIKTENRILKNRIDYHALLELDKLKQSGILTEEEFQKKKEDLLNPK